MSEELAVPAAAGAGLVVLGVLSLGLFGVLGIVAIVAIAAGGRESTPAVRSKTRYKRTKSKSKKPKDKSKKARKLHEVVEHLEVTVVGREAGLYLPKFRRDSKQPYLSRESGTKSVKKAVQGGEGLTLKWYALHPDLDGWRLQVYRREGAFSKNPLSSRMINGQSPNGTLLYSQPVGDDQLMDAAARPGETYYYTFLLKRQVAEEEDEKTFVLKDQCVLVAGLKVTIALPELPKPAPAIADPRDVQRRHEQALEAQMDFDLKTLEDLKDTLEPAEYQRRQERILDYYGAELARLNSREVLV